MNKPNQTGLYLIRDIDLNEIIPFIDWRFYFVAWRMPGRFDGIHEVYTDPGKKAEWLQTFVEKDREKADEALKLYSDIRVMLQEVLNEKSLTAHATYSIFPARGREEDIIVELPDGELVLPTLRQQKSSNDEFCYSLADFLPEKGGFIGAFANTIIGAEAISERYEKEDEVYKAILIKTLADRLAEATAEWLHWKVRKEFWGYAADENLSVDEMLKTQYRGIRPAVGYPSLPDQSLIFDLHPIINFDETGISLTENGAMYPNASVCGLYFDHPQSKYFMIGKIDEEQLNDYARRKGKAPDEIRKWLAANL